MSKVTSNYTPYDLLSAIRDQSAADRSARVALEDALKNPNDFGLLKTYVERAQEADTISILVERDARFKGQVAA